MPKKYQNTAFTTGKSAFSNVDAIQPTQATFSASAVTASVTGGKVPMVRGAIHLQALASAEVCTSDCPVSVTESVKLEFNVLQGAESLSALRAELDRLFVEASTDYAFTKGLVPPSYATFASE